MSNDFIWPEEKYQQRINPVRQYIDQAAKFLSVNKNITVDKAKQYITRKLKNKETNFHDPQIIYFERNDNWVKELKQGTLAGYLKSAIDNKEVIVPTFTTYVSPDVEQSLISLFMKRNAGRRGVLKKQAQVEEMRGNKELAYQLNNQQDNAKRNNNSMSGVMAAAGSIFENPTGHNTLTSMTRSMSSISNALNERMIGGNRHYLDSEAALNNMTALISTMDIELVHEAMCKYKLAVPTPDDIVDIVSRSANKYWRDPRHIKYIYDYAAKMTDIERAAVAYTQDLYHIRALNPQFMRDFIDDFAVWDESIVIEDPIDFINKIDPLIANYAHQVFITDLRGKDKDRRVWDKELQMKVAKACATIQRAIAKYKCLIDAFLVVRTLPCTTAHINHMARESVVLSDTDSTMFAVDDWVIWYFGELKFSDFAFAVAGSIMFVSTQLIAHGMAMLSANMNVARDKLFVLAMKPEFVFPVFAQTPVAKHYFCSVSVKEGGVYKENEYEIKGVHLKSSASPVEIVGAAQDRMKYILDLIQRGEEIDGYKELKRVADLERTIEKSIRNGESVFLKKMFIKSPTSYAKGPTESPFRYHTLWNEVFAPSYSSVEEPPYLVLKFPMLTDTKTKMANWLDSFKDKGLRDRYIAYLQKVQKTEIKTMYIAKDYVEAYGIPPEILSGVNIKRVILDLTVIDRMVLETIGIKPKHETLVSEMGY